MDECPAGNSPAIQTLALGTQTWVPLETIKTGVITVTRVALHFLCVQMTLSLSSRSILWRTSRLRMNINHARRFTPARSREVSTTLIRPLPDPPEFGAWGALIGDRLSEGRVHDLTVLYSKGTVLFILNRHLGTFICADPQGFI